MTGAQFAIDAAIRSGATTGAHRGISASRLILRVALFLALFRSTSMWPGYPTSQSDLGLIDPLPHRLMLYSLLPLMGLYAATDHRFVLRAISRLRPLYVLVVVALVVSVAISVDRRASLMGLLSVATISAPVVFHLLRFGAVETYRMVVYFCIAAIYVNALFTAAAPGSAIMTGALAGSVRGMFVHKNDFAQFLAASLVLVATVPSTRRLTHLQLHQFAATVLGAALLLASRSATAVVLVVAACLGYACIRFVNRIRGLGVRLYVASIVAGLIAVFGYVVLVVLPDAILEALGRDPTLTGRTGLWEVLYRVSLEAPWLGYGFAMFRQPEMMAQYWVEFGWAARSTHNTYLELALNIGYPATVLVVSVIVARLLARIVRLEAVPGDSRILVRQSVTIVLVLLASITQSGALLAPTINWLLLLSCLGPVAPIAAWQRSRIVLPRPSARLRRRVEGARPAT